MALKLNSSGGGSVTIDPVSTASNVTITIPATNAGSLVTADSSGNITNSGNLVFSGTAQRITGDFSNTTTANRLMFQTSTVNGTTSIGVIPNGTSVNSNFRAFGSADPTNTSTFSLGVNATEAVLLASATGTGTYLPISFNLNASEKMRIDISGNVTPGVTNTQTLGASGNVWSNVYSTTVTGTNGTFTGDIQATSLNGGPMAGLRNKIMNGNMGIAQRGTAAVTTTALFGPADRWFVDVVGDTFSTTLGSFVSGETLYDTGGAQYFSQIVVTSVPAVGNYATFAQRIEDVRTLAGQTVTVSFWAKSAAGTPTIGVQLVQNFGTGGTPSANAEGTGQAVTLTTTWTEYTKTFTIPSLNGKTLGTTANTSFTKLTFWLDAGSTFNSASGTIGQATKTVSIAQVQLEAGPVATPFEHRPIGMELTLCQRYYEKSFPFATAPATALGSGASGAHRFIAGKATTGLQYTNIRFAVPKRIAPITVVLYNPIAATAQVRDVTAVAECTAAATTATETNLFITCNGSATTAVGNALDIAWAVSADL